jgi:hypothetical protein
MLRMTLFFYGALPAMDSQGYVSTLRGEKCAGLPMVGYLMGMQPLAMGGII